jgi:glycosyltransferase involved in cell wall biosynthesis
VRSAVLAVLAVLRLVAGLGGKPGIVYLPLSQSTPGVLRDSLFVFAASLRGWKVAIHLRGSDFHHFYRGSYPIARRWIRAALARVDSAAVMGHSLEWVFEGLIPADRIAVVANGTPEHRSSGVHRDPQHVLFLSNLRRRKGVVEAVDAALLALQEQPSARFSFVGAWEDGELERELRRRAAAADGAIVFRPPVQGKDKDDLLASGSILLFPPVEPEGHPRVVLEALAAGLPVVTTNRGAIGETVVDGESGFVLDEPDPARLAEHLRLLLADRDLRERMSTAARARHQELFTQEIADRRLASWLQSVADADRRRSEPTAGKST